MRKRSIALIGMPGAGKSGVGKRLAEKLGLAFIDTDALVEKSEGMAVADVFAQKGEAYFRAREREAVQQAAKKCAVISCGGGVPLWEENVRALQQNGTVVYLYATVQTLCAHVGNGAGRPLLAGDARERIEKLFAERAAAYRAAADAVIVTDGKSVEEVADEAARLWRSV
ncbi:MAG: shikimate kinase [Clostridia bacterium]|jgi:shikimate kinase|nr:shikimate kinase [Clostridia bacterium]